MDDTQDQPPCPIHRAPSSIVPSSIVRTGTTKNQKPTTNHQPTTHPIAALISSIRSIGRSACTRSCSSIVISGASWSRQRYNFSRVLRRMCGHRSEEHTSELQSRGHLVCRLLLEKKIK